MTGYTRVYNESTGQTVEASDFNTEFQSIDDAFDESTGHKHDGSNDEGAYVPLISDSDNNNSVEIDTGNNEIDFSVEVSSSKTRQMVLTDGALLPDTDDDLDLGSATYQFKDAYIDGTANIDSLVADTADINGGTIDGATVGGSSAGAGTFTNLTATGTVTLPADSVDTDDIAAGALPSDVTVNDDNWSGTDLAVANGGTGSSTASGARTALGLAIGSDVQAHDAQLDDIAALAVTNGNFIVGDGVNWVAESGATARSSLGLGSIATQNSSSVSITGGSITGITDLAVADGGTGASTASGARTNLGLGTAATEADTKYNHRSNNLSDVASAATAFSNIKQAATTTATGVVELATDAETQAGTDTERVVTPAGLASVGYLSSVTESDMGAASVNQAALKSTQHTASMYQPTGTGASHVVLTGGRYILGWRTWISGGATYDAQFASGASNTSAATYAYLNAQGGGSPATVYFENTYIQASPPYDLGDGEVAGLIFALIDNVTRTIEGVSVSADPPWANNGPTNIRPDIIQEGRKYRLIRRLTNRLISASDDPVLRAELFAELQSAPMEMVEITQDVKQADMSLIPHPWHMGNDLTGKTVVLLDPVSELVARLVELHNAGENVNEILHADYLRPDNTALTRSGPPGVMIVTPQWRNKG